jgi:hypothetical protein
MTDPKPPTHERGPPHGPLALQFDAHEFAHFLDESDLTHDQKLEYIRTIWSIVLQFIDMGFGIHPLQQACGQFSDADILCGDPDSDALKSLHPTLCTDFESAGGCLCLRRIPQVQGGEAP